MATTKAQRTERDEAIARLRAWIKPGDTVYTILDHVSSSGMSRAIRVVVPYVRREVHDGGHWRELGKDEIAGDRATRETVDHVHPNHAVGIALGIRHWKRQGREQDALVVGGCGMDMGFHLVNSLSTVLYGGRTCPCYQADPREGWHPAPGCPDCAGTGTITGSGYACLGQGKCPSNYHNNYRGQVDCPGVGDRRCYAPSSWGRWTPAEDWPRRMIDLGEGAIMPAGYLACLQGSGEDGTPYEVCPTCAGVGSLPNPEGPERFDLVHTDGYAVRHRWL